jgi:hypothetical protein
MSGILFSDECTSHEIRAATDTNMTKIDSSSALLFQMSEQISAVVRQDRSVRRPADASGSRKSVQRDLEKLILGRIAAVDPVAPDSRRKAFRLFLESVLAHELGEDLLSDPGYHQIVDKVHDTMQKNAAVSAAMDQAGDFLLSAAKNKTGLNLTA